MNNLNILYEDNHVIVVVKPPNILVQADITGDVDMLTIIKDYLKEKYHKPGNVYLGLVHRLDRVVGGVMVFAKTSKAASRLSDSIRKREVKKMYLAVCHGKINERGKFVDYLKKLDNFSSVITTEKDGKLSSLSYELIDYNKEKDLSLAKISLETGRHHQIRVGFASRKHALVGDSRYGKDNEKEIGLFAYQLSFYHPTTKKELTFTYIPHSRPFNLFNMENIV